MTIGVAGILRAAGASGAVGLSTFFAGDDEPGQVLLGDISAIDFTNVDPLSISFWFKHPVSGPTGVIISKLDVGGTDNGWQVIIGGDIRFDMRANGGTERLRVRTIIDTYDDNVWHHALITKDSSSDAAGVTIYVDGSVSALEPPDFDTLASSTANSGDAIIGSVQATANLYWLGNISDVGVYNKELSAAEDTAISNPCAKNLKLVGPSADLVGNWRMGQGDVFPNVFDLSASGNDGTMEPYLHRMRVVADRPPASPATQFALGMGGSASVQDTRFDFGKTDPFTIAVWFRTDSGSGVFPSLFQHLSGTQGYKLQVEGFFTPGSIAISLAFDLGTTEYLVATDIAYNDGLWHHCVMTYDGSASAAGVTFYIDGVSVASTVERNTLGANDFAVAAPLILKDAHGSGFLVGSTCQGIIYNKELTSGEVTTIYGGGTPPNLAVVGPTANIVAYWEINEADLPNLPTIADQGPNNLPLVSDTTLRSIVADSAPC